MITDDYYVVLLWFGCVRVVTRIHTIISVPTQPVLVHQFRLILIKCPFSLGRRTLAMGTSEIAQAREAEYKHHTRVGM